MLRLVPTPKTALQIRPISPAPAPVIPIVAAAPFERTPEGIIVAAVAGNPAAPKLLRPLVVELARAATVYLEDAERIASEVVTCIKWRRAVGRPRPGNAVRWLENVTRAFAKNDFETTSLEAEEEPPQADDTDE